MTALPSLFYNSKDETLTKFNKMTKEECEKFRNIAENKSVSSIGYKIICKGINR